MKVHTDKIILRLNFSKNVKDKYDCNRLGLIKNYIIFNVYEIYVSKMLYYVYIYNYLVIERGMQQSYL